MADTILDWVDATIADSGDQWAYFQSLELDDTFGWGAMTEAMLSRLGDTGSSPKEQSGTSGGLLLTGPEGCGKHTAAAHMMKRLAEEGYEMVFLNGLDLAPLGMAQVRQCLEALLTAYIDRDQALCIQLEETEDCSIRRELLNYFGQQLQNYRIADFPPLFLVLIDSREQEIPARLRSQLMLCRMSQPSVEQRSRLLDIYGKGLDRILSQDVFARATEGASYAQVLDMITALIWLVDSRDLVTLPDDELLDFVKGQMPEPTREDSLSSLALSVRQLVDQLPGLISRGARVVEKQERTETVFADTLDDDQFLSKKRREIEEMDVRDLAIDLFSEEGVDEMLEASLIPS